VRLSFPDLSRASAQEGDMDAVDTEEKSGQLAGDGQYRQLLEEHHQLDRRLHELTERSYLSTPEQLEESILKKQKLAVKDRMAGLTCERPVEHGS
jgi:uncharacterized protein YdcH (DUF465 family)